MNRSLLTHDTDGLIKDQPRWVHHLAKVLVGTICLVGAYVVIRIFRVDVSTAWILAALVSLTIFITHCVSYGLDHSSNPFTLDTICDGALHMLPAALVFLAVADIANVGMALLIACLVSYWLTYPYATP